MSTRSSSIYEEPEVDRSQQEEYSRIWSQFPPPSLNPSDAGVCNSFKEAYIDTFRKHTSLKSPESYDWMERFNIPDYHNQPKLFLDLAYVNLEMLMDAVVNRPKVWVRSFVLEVMTLLGTCLSFRKENKSETTAPTENAKVSDYFIPSRILMDFVRSLEVVCMNHFEHYVTEEKQPLLQEKFQQSNGPHEFMKEECDNAHTKWLVDAPGCDIAVQTDVLPLPPSEEKQFSQSPSPRRIITPAPQAKVSVRKRLSSKHTSTTAPSRVPTKQPSARHTPTPQPMSESDSSRHSLKRIPTKPHLVLTRVFDADLMDYCDARHAWDNALDGSDSPSTDLFRASNIHRFRRLGTTGLGIIFKRPPTPRQLKRFVASCSKHRDSFNRVFRSVSSSGVKIALYDEAHRSPPYPTRLTFEETRNQCLWSPPQYVRNTQPPPQPPFFKKRFPTRRPAPHRFPAPPFGNAFPTQHHFSPPHPQQEFQTQIAQLQEQMHQLMQMQTQLFEQFQRMAHNGF